MPFMAIFDNPEPEIIHMPVPIKALQRLGQDKDRNLKAYLRTKTFSQIAGMTPKFKHTKDRGTLH